MTEEELIETLKAFEKERVENLPESSRNLFYAIMSIADERDEYKKVIEEIRKFIDNALPCIHDEEILNDLLDILNKTNKEERI